jgi:hypothetical protein
LEKTARGDAVNTTKQNANKERELEAKHTRQKTDAVASHAPEAARMRALRFIHTFMVP